MSGRGAGRARSVLGWVITLALIGLLQAFLTRGMVDGGRVPALGGQQTDGQVFAGIAQLPKPALVYIWASWCGVCRAMQGTLNELAKTHALVTVATQSGDRATVSAYMAAHDFHVPTLVDEDGRIARRFGIRGVPALFFIDRQGDIRSVASGYTSSWGIRLRLWLAGRPADDQ